MAETEKVNISWPSFDVEFYEKFQIFLYTRPYNVRIDVCECGFTTKVISSVEVEVPGQHVYTLTSTQSLLKDVAFKEVQKIDPPKPAAKKTTNKNTAKEEKKNRALSLKADEKDKKLKDGEKADPKADESDDNVTVINGQASKKQDENGGKNDEQKKADDEDPEEEDEEEENLIVLKNDLVPEKVIYGGSLLVQIGWKGYGPHMPPANAGGFGVFRPSAKKIEEEKPAQLEEEVDEELKKMYDEELLMDVNDPRNYETIERIRKMRNKQIRNILKHDVKIPLWETPSLRHKLIKMKFTDPELMSIDLPLREELIQKDKRLMKFLLDDYEIKLKTKIEKNTMEAEPVFIQTIDQVDAFPQSPETIDRINQIRTILLKRANYSKLQKTLGIFNNYPLESVINETRVFAKPSEIFDFLKQIFAQRRKLRPQQKKSKGVVNISEYKSAKISIHAIKGINVPARKRGAIKSLNHLDTNNIGAGELSQTIRATEMTQGNVIDLEKLANAELIPSDVLTRKETSEEPVTYVQARIVDNKGDEYVVSTHTFSGVDPEWNETIELIYYGILSKK